MEARGNGKELRQASLSLRSTEGPRDSPELQYLVPNSRMSDPLSRVKRSQTMRAIRSKGNRTTELRLVRVLRSNHVIGWRRHQKLPSNPDFTFRRERLIVFVDGCFWHGCRWHCRMPKNNNAYWLAKITRNRGRDRQANKILRKSGWRVLRIWEHSLKSPTTVVARIRRELRLADGSRKTSSQ